MGNWACAGAWPAESWAAPPCRGRAAEGPGRNRAKPAVRAAMPPRAVRNDRRRMRVLLEAWARNGSGQLLDDAEGRAVDLPSRRQCPPSANHVLTQPALEGFLLTCLPGGVVVPIAPDVDPKAGRAD